MKREARVVQCGCGCGKQFHTSQLTTVEICQALDAEGKRTQLTRVIVGRACKEPYEIEMGLLKMLQVVSRRWAPKPKTFWQRVNVFGTFHQWIQRIGAAVEVMKTVHAINERNKGFEWAKRHAVQSAVLFGCPRFMQGFLSRRFLLRAKRRKDKEDATIKIKLSITADETA